MARTKKHIEFAFLTLIGFGCLNTARAGTINAIYAFGDSLTDVGNVYTLTGGTIPAAPYASGQFSNGNVWVQDLAADLGLTPLTASLLGGTDYAYGSAETGATPVHTATSVDLTGASGQIAQFESTHATADPNALYTIWIGANDLDDLLSSNPSAAQAAADIGAAVVNIDSAIGTLAGLGAKNFLIVNVPDLGLTPFALAAGPTASAAAIAGFGRLRFATCQRRRPDPIACESRSLR